LLRWRLIIGTVLVAVLLGLCWLDAHAIHQGVWLFPLAVVICVLATDELLAMFRAVGHEPHKWATHSGALLALAGASAPIAWPGLVDDTALGGLGFLMLGIVAGLVINILVELWRYVAPGKAITQLALSTFAVIYIGGLLGFLVQLRLLNIGGDVSRGGMLALFSMIATVKFTDIGAYFAGHRFGKHKMAPVVSPGKTWEGAAGGLVLGTLAAMLTLGPFARSLGVPSERDWLPWLGGAILYGVIVSASGMIGDLAESLLKRDAGVKDSSTWLPGFGGVLDLLDSLLLAAPVAYVLWISGIVAP
jgi:phosphatidate cytidylyltransferase